MSFTPDYKKRLQQNWRIMNNVQYVFSRCPRPDRDEILDPIAMNDALSTEVDAPAIAGLLEKRIDIEDCAFHRIRFSGGDQIK
jgi:hypothetical protein